MNVSGTQATVLSAGTSDDREGVAYRGYRNGMAVGGTGSLRFTDYGLKLTTEYVYEVTVLDSANNDPYFSALLRVPTTAGYRINFQYGTEESLVGYQIDAGSKYDFRKRYGRGRKLNGRNRKSHADPRLNIFKLNLTLAI